MAICSLQLWNFEQTTDMRPESPEFKIGLKRASKMSSFRFRLLASLAFVALCWGQGQARAGDLEECLGPALERTEAACTAILNDVERPTEDRVKAYAARSRFFNARGKFDAGRVPTRVSAPVISMQRWPIITMRSNLNRRTRRF
jgi:hypothetical protein